jgi:hypothetical protein
MLYEARSSSPTGSDSKFKQHGLPTQLRDLAARFARVLSS